MPRCNLSNSCFFFNEMSAELPRTMEYLSNKYCEGNFMECARFILARIYGEHNVPTYLYPDELARDKCHPHLRSIKNAPQPEAFCFPHCPKP